MKVFFSVSSNIWQTKVFLNILWGICFLLHVSIIKKKKSLYSKKTSSSSDDDFGSDSDSNNDSEPERVLFMAIDSKDEESVEEGEVDLEA